MDARLRMDLGEDKNFLHRFVGLGSRKTDSPSNQAARKLIIEEMLRRTNRELGFAIEDFPVQACASDEAFVCINGQKIAAHLLDYTGGKGSNVSGELVYLKGGREADFRHADIKNKIVACDYSALNHRFYQIRRAVLYGAAAVIVISQHKELFQIGIGSPGYEEPCPIPAVSLKKGDWERSVAHIGQDVSIEYVFRIENRTGKNLIFDYVANNTQKTVVIGAHYDSWCGGAQDNGVAVAMLTSLAGEVVSRKIDCNVRFIFFDAEELGMLGSSWHTDHALTDRYAAYINLEMPVPCHGTKFKAMFYSGRLWPRRGVPIFELASHFVFPIPIEFYYWLTKSPVFPADIDSFHKKNIPSISTYCNNPFHHTSEDTCEKIRWTSYEYVCSFVIRLIENFKNEMHHQPQARIK